MNESTDNLTSQENKRFSIHWKKVIKWIIIILVVYFFIFVLYNYFSLPDVSYLQKENPKLTALMQLRIEEAERAGKKLKIRQHWVSFRNIPKLLKQTVRISEDASFYKHEGVDYDELKESFKKNWQKGEFARGGSTITQQLAKNLFLSTEKSITRKIKEYFIARRLEKALSKNRIFHLYLNVIEFGPGIFGVQAAAHYYFGKNVSKLSLVEIIRLTAIIPRPLITSPKSNRRWMKWKAKWILGKLKKYKYIDDEQYNATLPAFI